jgi:hypothetical protein
MSGRAPRRTAILATSLATAVLGAAAIAPANAAAACSKPVFQDPNTVVQCPAIGVEQSFRVPAGVRRLRVIVIGAAGGNGSDSVVCSGGTIFRPGPPCDSVATGARGGVATIASGELRVRPRRRLFVHVGGRGATVPGPAGGAGGFNGGGRGGVLRQGRGASNYMSGGGGGGGGASDVRTCSVLDRSCDTLASRLIVAAGGGGGGGAVSFAAGFPGEGGTGGGVAGEIADGSPADGGAFAPGGLGATAKGGGAAGGSTAAPGTRGAGGAGGDLAENFESAGGGGGGGGLFGGGGGSAGGDTSSPGSGGGGGSSFGPRGTRYAHGAMLEPGVVRFIYLSARVARP